MNSTTETSSNETSVDSASEAKSDKQNLLPLGASNGSEINGTQSDFQNTTTSSNTTEINPFLTNLASTYHVDSIPLAIFLLILSCIFAIILAVILVYFIRWIMRRCFGSRAKTRRKRNQAIYVDEIPGFQPDTVGSKNPSWLQYSIEYKLKQQVLIVAVVQSNNLTSLTGLSPTEFYVTLDCEHVDQASGFMHKIGKINRTKPAELKSGIAWWNELFSFTIPEKQISDSRLVFRLLEVNPGGRDHEHGKLYVALKDEDMSEYVGGVLEKTGEFGSPLAIVSHNGELCIGMAYYPRDERLDVHILEAHQLVLPKNLKSDKQGHIYVSVSLRRAKHVLKKYETDKRKELESPYFNQKFSFKLKDEHRTDAYVLCTVKYHGSWGSRKPLGHILIGPESKLNSGVKQWEETLSNPSKVNIYWHFVKISEH